MPVLLAIDAAWTASEPSGIALVASCAKGWRCVALAPSYDAFLALASGTPVDWTRPRFSGSVPDVDGLLAGAGRLAGAPVDLVTVDIPIATVPITGRRAADDAVSRAFGGRGCSAHTPNPTRPGLLGASLSAAFAAAGFPIATAAAKVTVAHHLLEVYPHPALLALLRRSYRIPYKVAKTRRYWPSCSRVQRIGALLAEFQAIHDKLLVLFGSLGLPLPQVSSIQTLSSLKRYEDALDALVCAWVGSQYMQGKTVAFGDHTAAIWCPQDSTGQK